MEVSHRVFDPSQAKSLAATQVVGRGELLVLFDCESGQAIGFRAIALFRCIASLL